MHPDRKRICTDIQTELHKVKEAISGFAAFHQVRLTLSWDSASVGGQMCYLSRWAAFSHLGVPGLRGQICSLLI